MRIRVHARPSPILPPCTGPHRPLTLSATPTSAAASAGASFTPSPTMATVRPAACSARTRSSLSAGVRPPAAAAAGTPAAAATTATVAGSSPDMMWTWGCR